MSLLMDALRKAEQQKQQGEAAGALPTPKSDNLNTGNLSLEPLPEQGGNTQPASGPAFPQTDTNRHLPELPQRLEELDDQFFTSDPAVQKPIRAPVETKTRGTDLPPPAGKATAPSSRDAAQNIFAAKQPATAVSNGFAIVVGTATLIAIAVIGGYFYWQMQPKGGLVASPGLPSLSATTPSAPTPVVATTPPQTPLTTGEPAKTTATAAPAGMAVNAQDHDDARKTGPSAMNTSRGESGMASTARSATAPAAPAAQTQTANQTDAGIHFSTKTRKTDSSMEIAHAAFTRGDNEQARSIWVKTLQSDSRNINALHGLAALALQEGRPEQASLIYRRVLEGDPKDAVANAGLASINASRDARQTESQLKGLLSEQPESPHLNFSLGNLYMAESRWSEAQQAFFKAHVAAPGNPDFLYNLAVSLDHLHQARLAAQYYARALSAAKSQRASFDTARVEERINTLQAESK